MAFASPLNPLQSPFGGLGPLGSSYTPPDPFADQGLTPEEEQTLLKQLLRSTMGGLEATGYALDTPGALTRGLLAGKPGQRLSGRELLTAYGLTRPNDPNRWELADVAGLGADILVDPLTWLNPFGALTKAGKLAKGAGVSSADIAKVAAQKYGAELGKIGPRQARQMLTLGDLQQGLKTAAEDATQQPWANDLLQKLTQTAELQKIDPATLAGQKLGGQLGWEVPFTGLGGVIGGTGAKSQALARGLDQTGAALAASWPGRKLTELFSPGAQGMATAPAQRAMQGVTAEQERALETVRQQAKSHLDALTADMTQAMPTLTPHQHNEIYSLIAEHNPEATDLATHLKIGGYDLPPQSVIDRVQQMRQQVDASRQMLIDAGLDPQLWKSEFGTNYFPRQKLRGNFGEASADVRGADAVMNLNKDSDIARNAAYDVPGGRVAVTRLSVDPNIAGPDSLLKGRDERAQYVLQHNPWTADVLQKPVQSAISPSGKVYVAHEASARADIPEQLVMVDPQKLDAGWKQGLGEMYVPPGAESVAGRRAGVEEFLKKNEPIQAPRIDLQPNTGAVQFADGRHRFAVLRDSGEQAVGVMVPADQVDEVAKRFGAATGAIPQTGAEALQGAIAKQADAAWKPASKLDQSVTRVASQFEGMHPGVLKRVAADVADQRKSEVESYREMYDQAVKGRFSPGDWKLIQNGSLDAASPELRKLKLDEVAQEFMPSGLIPSDSMAPGEDLLNLLRQIGSPTAATQKGGSLGLFSVRDPNFIDQVAKQHYGQIFDESKRLQQFTPDEQRLLKLYDKSAGLAEKLKVESPARAKLSDAGKGVSAGLFDNHVVQDWEKAITDAGNVNTTARGMFAALADAAENVSKHDHNMSVDGPNNVLERLGFGTPMLDESGKVVDGYKDTSRAMEQFQAALQAAGKDASFTHVPIKVVQDMQRLKDGMRDPEWLKGLDQVTRFTKSMLTFSPAFHSRNLSSGQLQNLFTGAYDFVRHPVQTSRVMRDAWAMARGQETKHLHNLPIVKKQFPGGATEAQARAYLTDLATQYGAVDPSIAESVGKEAQALFAVKGGTHIPVDPTGAGDVAYNALDKRTELVRGRGKKDPISQIEAMRGARSQGQDRNVLSTMIANPDVTQMYNGPDALTRYLGTNPIRTATPINHTLRGVGSELGQGLKDLGNPLLRGDLPGAWQAFKEGPLNSANIAGLRGDISRSALQKGHEKLSQNVELFNRLGGFFGWLQQGIHPAEAAARVRASQVDYKALSPFEKSVMRRMVPFYSFNRRMADFVANDLLEHPGGGISQAIQATNAGRTDDSFVPDYVGEGAAIPLGGGSYITGLGLMHEGPLNTFALGNGLGDTVHRTAQKMGAQLNPLAKLPIEAATKVNLFTGRPLNELYQYPIQGATSTTAQLANSTLMNSPLSRAITITRKLQDPRKDIPEKLLNLGTGINITTLSGGIERAKEMEARKALEELLKRTPSVKSMENLYVKKEDLAKMSPEELRAYAMYKLMKQRAKVAAKKRAEEAAAGR